MINRVLIRLKIVQVVYAYYQNPGKSVDAAEKELFFSLSKAYDLYHYMLMLMPAITDFALRRIESARQKLAPSAEDLKPNTRFVENKFIAQLEANKQLREYAEKQKRSWEGEDLILKTLYEQVTSADIYKQYMSLHGEITYEDDRELWRRLYKTVICDNEDLDAFLEEQSLYWNDDKAIVDSFVLKTIRRFDEAAGADQALLPEYKAEEDRDFARRLFRRTIVNGEQYRKLISDNTRNWDSERVAMMDMVIMQCALAELFSFPEIPMNVTFNEYVEIAKAYSTNRSGAFVNGTLDGIVKVLRQEGKLVR